MSLGIALKNRTGIVLAADHNDSSTPSATSHFITLHNRSVVIITGNRAAVEATVYRALANVKDKDSTAAVAQFIHAELQIEVVPKIAQITGRVEIIVGGIDPIRHTTEPDAYYMDSQKAFFLTVDQGPVMLTGTTAVAEQLLQGVDITNKTTAQLSDLAKECFTATRLRWPSVVAPRLKLAVIEPGSMQVYDL